MTNGAEAANTHFTRGQRGRSFSQHICSSINCPLFPSQPGNTALDTALDTLCHEQAAPTARLSRAIKGKDFIGKNIGYPKGSPAHHSKRSFLFGEHQGADLCQPQSEQILIKPP